MEALGDVSIFSRREANYQLRYLNFYGDCDSRSFRSVRNIYPGHQVINEYIGHVQKRMGNRLCKRRKMTKGLGGPGRLNDMIIDKLQNYYGIAIRRNSGKTVEVMKKAIRGGIFHVCSSKGKPYHDQ